MTGADAYQIIAHGASDMAGHLKWLRAHARGKVVEIGVRNGFSTAALLAGVRASGPLGHVYSVDREDCGALYTDEHWTFIRGDSLKESERILDETKMRSNELWINLLLIDGDHTFHGCFSDLTNFGKYAKVIAVHDTNSEYFGVWQATIEYFRCGGFRRAEFRNESNGLGVLYR